MQNNKRKNALIKANAFTHNAQDWEKTVYMAIKATMGSGWYVNLLHFPQFYITDPKMWKCMVISWWLPMNQQPSLCGSCSGGAVLLSYTLTRIRSERCEWQKYFSICQKLVAKALLPNKSTKIKADNQTEESWSWVVYKTYFISVNVISQS